MEAQLTGRLGAAGLVVVALAALWGVGQHLGQPWGGWMAAPTPLYGPAYRLASWSLAASAGALYAWLWRTSGRQAVGMALMWVPVARVVVSIYNDFEALTTGGQVLPSYSTRRLSDFYIYGILRNLGYVGAGFLVWSGWRPQDTLLELTRRVRSTGAPLVRGSERHGVLVGLAFFPMLLGLAFAFNAAASGIPQLVNSDESSIWDNMTPWHGIMISAAAAVGEEVVYRAFLMTSLAAVLARFRAPGHWPWMGAVAAQGILFGFAHAGYANWLHVIEATLFGVLAGVAALRFGIWMPIVIHFLVDIYAIGGHADNELWRWLLVVALLANVVFALAFAAKAVQRHRQSAAAG